RLAGIWVAGDAKAWLGGLKHGGGAHHHARDHAQWRERVARHPLGKAHRQGGQWRNVGEPRRDGLELLVGDRLARLADRPIPDHAEALLWPERHQYEGAGGGLDPLGEQIVVGLIECEWQEHRHASGGGHGGSWVFFKRRKQTMQSRGPRSW